MDMIYRLIREDEGVSLAEEGLLVALIALACILALGYVGGQLNAIFTYIGDQLTTP